MNTSGDPERSGPSGRSIFRKDRPAIGVGVVELCGPSLAALLAAAGADYVLFDMEHTSLSFRDLADLAAAAHAAQLPVVVRPPDVSAGSIGKALDLGADGILAQNVSSGEEAAAAVRFAKYPPLGERGDDGRISSSPDPGAAIDELNASTVVLVIVESASGADRIDEICETPGIDAVWIGPSDLSLSLGVPGQFESDAYRAAEERVVDACRAHRMPFAIGAAPTASAAVEQIRRGCFMVFSGDELSLLRRALSDYVRDVRASPETPGA